MNRAVVALRRKQNSLVPCQADPVLARVRSNPSVKGACLRQAPYVER